MIYQNTDKSTICNSQDYHGFQVLRALDHQLYIQKNLDTILNISFNSRTFCKQYLLHFYCFQSYNPPLWSSAAVLHCKIQLL